MVKTWNPFSWYINIITRVNFMVQFVSKDKIQRNIELSKRNIQSKILDEHRLGNLNSLDKGSRFCVGRKELFCSFKPSQISISTSTKRCSGCSRDDWAYYNYFHNQASSLRRSASSDLTNIVQCVTPQQTKLLNNKASSLTVKSLSDRITEVSSSNDLECSYIQLGFFFLLVFSATTLMLKLLLYSTVWSRSGILENSEHDKYKYQNLTLIIYQSYGENYIQTKDIIYDFLFSDIFASFSNSRLFNLIALTSLSAGAIARSLYFIKLFGEFVLKKNAKSRVTRRQFINIVQLNLSYLYSLRTTTNDWLQLLIKSWYHEHKIAPFQCEKLKFTLNIPKANINFFSCFDMKTKLYFYNMIQFDYCYSEYFTLSNDTSKQVSSARNLSNQETSLNEIFKRRVFEENLGKYDTKAGSIYAAQPTHRMDLYEMAWLLLMLIVLYTLSILSILMPILCCLAMEMNIKTFKQLRLPTEIDEFAMVMTSFSFGRWTQLFVWQCLVILAIFDLFNFFSCCLICYSRARYLRLELQQVLTHCLLINSANKKNSLFKVVREYGLMCSEAEGERSKKINSKIFNDLNSEINSRLEVIMDWILLLQRELVDVKKFFSFYLSLEIILKVICLIYALSAVSLAKGYVFEDVFLVINTNTAVTPIVIVIITATLIEKEFRCICKVVDVLLFAGRGTLTIVARKKMIRHSSYLSDKDNRSIVIAGSYSLSLGSALPVVGWIASGIVLLRRTQETR